MKEIETHIDTIFLIYMLVDYQYVRKEQNTLHPPPTHVFCCMMIIYDI